MEIMNKPVIFVILIASLAPFTVAADEKYEVTIRVLEMDEKTPESVINTISLPQISIDAPSVVDKFNAGSTDNSDNWESGSFADDLGSNMDSPDIEVDVGEIQGEVNSHGNGK